MISVTFAEWADQEFVLGLWTVTQALWLIPGLRKTGLPSSNPPRPVMRPPHKAEGPEETVHGCGLPSG